MILALFLIGLLAPYPAGAQSASTAAARSISLEGAFALAAARSEILAQRGEAVAELEANIDEIWSNVKPRFAIAASNIWQDTPPPSSSGGFANNFTQSSRPQAAITGHQALFSGLREFLAAKSGKAQGESARLALQRAKQMLYQDVSRAYLDLLGAYQEIAVRQSLLELTSQRIKDLKERQKIGRSRTSEVLAAESQRAQTSSQLETVRGQEKVYQWMLGFLTGVEGELAPAGVALPVQEDLSHFLELARERADVRARRLDKEASALFVDIQSRQRWPTVALDGNYYLKRPAGFSEKIRWDATLSASLPLYAGDSIGAQVRQARARDRSAGQALTLALRQAELEVRSAHSQLGSALTVVAALENATTLAQANARAQSEDYRLGLVTNLEVLGSWNTAEETRLRLEQARLDAYWSRVRLEVAAGGPKNLP